MRSLPAALVALALLFGGLIGADEGVAAPVAPASSASTGSSSGSPSAGSSSTASTGSSSAAPTGSTTPPGAGRSPKAPGPACTTNADALTPVLCLPADFHEDRAANVVIGGVVGFAAQLVNNGPDVAGAKLVITLPPQLRKDADPVLRVDDWYDDPDESGDGSDGSDSSDDGTGDDKGTALTCVATDAGATLTCDTGAVPTGTNALIGLFLRTTSAARPDTSATFTATLRPDTDGAFPATSVRGTVRFLLPAKLAIAITPRRADVVLGEKRDLRVTVRNTGTGPAPDTIGVTVLLPKNLREDGIGRSHFAITNAPKIDVPIGAVAGASRAATSSLFVARAGDDSPDPRTQFGLWPVGTIRPGATAAFTVTVRAKTLGSDVLSAFAFTTTLDPTCEEDPDEDSPFCEGRATAALRAVHAPPTPDGSGTPIGSGDAVANTGAGDLTPQLWFGVLALLAGVALTYGARTRRLGAHRR